MFVCDINNTLEYAIDFLILNIILYYFIETSSYS